MPPTPFDFEKEIGAVKTPTQQGGFDFSKELGVPPTGGLVASAKQMVGQTIKGAGQVGADFIPGVSQDNAVSQYGQSVIDANPTAVGSLKDIASRPLTAATEAVGNALPSLGSIVGLRALGTAVTAAAPFTGIAAPVTAGVGQAVSWGGPLIAAALPSYSGIRDAQMENGTPTTTKDKAVAGAGALASGAIELVGGPQTRIIKAISGGLERKAGEGVLKAAGKEAFKSGLEEAGEELVQSPIEQLASYQSPTSAANIEQTLFGGAMGFIGGGIAGGGMQAVAGRQQEAAPAAEDRDTRTTETVQAKALEGMVGTHVAVSNGQAYVQTGEGDFVVAPLDKLTQHFATGGTLENVNTEALTADSLGSLQTQLDDANNPVDLGYLTKLRNSRTELIRAGVNKQDVDTMILNNTENTPGRREYVAQLLASGQPDPTAIQEIGSGKIDSPNAPLQAEWQRQEELAAATNRSSLRRLQETAQRVQGEKDLISYWRSIGAVDTPEEGRAQLDAWRAAQEERIAQDNADLDQAVASAMVGGSQEALQAKQTAMRNRYALQRLQNQGADVQKKRAIAEAMAEYEQTLRVPGSDAITARQQDNLDILEYWISAGEITSKEELKRAELSLPSYWRSGGLTADQLNRQQTATPVGPPPTEVLPPSPSAAPLTGVAPQQSQPQEVQNGQVQEGRNTPQVEPLLPSQAAAQPATPATVERVQSEVKSFLGDVGHANLVRRGKLEVVQTQEDIPAGGEPFKGPSGTMAGAYDPATKRVYLVAGNLAPGDGEYVFRHEAVHALLREDRRFVRQKSGILSSFETLAAKDASIREAIASVPDNTRGELRSEEALAYWIQNPANHTHSLFKRIVAAVKAALRRLGVNTKYSAAEIAQMFTRGTKQWAAVPVPVEQAPPLVAPKMLYSQATASIKQGQKSLLGKVADIAAGQKVEQAPRWLAVSPLHFLVQTVGRKIPQVQQLSRHLEEANHISETMVSEAMQYYTEALDTKQQDKINRVAGVSSFNRMLPWAPITEQDWVPQDAVTRAAKLQGAEMRWKAAGMDKSTGKSFIAAYNEASKAYASLDEKAQTVYQTIVQHMQQMRGREKNNLRAYIERTTVGDEALKEQLLQRYRATFNDISGAYWPLNRVGDFRLEYVDIDGVRTVTHHSTDAERRGVIESLVADGVDRDTIMESYKDKRPRSEVAIPSELMQQLSAAVYKQKMAEVSPEDYAAVADAKDAAQAVVDDMNQIWLRWQPETSALKNAVQRKNVKGFSEDMLRSYLDYTQRHAGSIAWSEQGRKVEDTLKSLADDIRESRKTPGNKDATFKGMVLNDLRNRVQALRTAKIGPVASTLGRLGTAFYMTSPSTAVVQMTQLPILTLPKMATMYKSWGKASAAMARGVQQAFSSKFAKDKLFGDMNVDALHDMMRSTVTEEMEGKGQAAGKGLGEPLFSREEIEARYKQLTPYQQQLFVLREALARNLLDISAAHEAFALTQGKNPNSKLNKAFKYAMLPMQLSEMASRKAAILSSMALSQDEASKDTPGSKKGFYEIMRDVSEVVNDTLYSYAKSNKPAVLQGGTARVLAMFQWYRIMTALRIGMLFKRSIAAETPEMKSAARKEFIGIMGMTGALAGAIGMPMTQLVFAALDALADDDEPRDSELEFRNWAAERLGPQWGDILVHGLPSTLGVDLSRRIGLDNIYGSQSQAPERLHGKELAAWWAANQLGPIFGIVQGAFQGYDLMVNKGEYAKGLEAAVPKPIRDALKATRVMGDGELTSTSGKKIIGEDKLTGDAAILMALGLNPAEVSQAQSASMSKSTLSTKLTERRGRLIRDAVDAITGEGDRDEALAAVRAFNKKMPAFAISGGDIRTALVRGIKESAGVQSKRDALIARQFSVPTY